MVVGTALLRARRFPTFHAIHYFALQAFGSAAAFFAALLADGLGEFIKTAHKELQQMPFHALKVFPQLLPHQHFGWLELAVHHVGGQLLHKVDLAVGAIGAGHRGGLCRQQSELPGRATLLGAADDSLPVMAPL
jgi:hypothetical protein